MAKCQQGLELRRGGRTEVKEELDTPWKTFSTPPCIIAKQRSHPKFSACQFHISSLHGVRQPREIFQSSSIPEYESQCISLTQYDGSAAMYEWRRWSRMRRSSSAGRVERLLEPERWQWPEVQLTRNSLVGRFFLARRRSRTVAFLVNLVKARAPRTRSCALTVMP